MKYAMLPFSAFLSFPFLPVSFCCPAGSQVFCLTLSACALKAPARALRPAEAAAAAYHNFGIILTAPLSLLPPSTRSCFSPCSGSKRQLVVKFAA